MLQLINTKTLLVIGVLLAVLAAETVRQERKNTEAVQRSQQVQAEARTVNAASEKYLEIIATTLLRQERRSAIEDSEAAQNSQRIQAGVQAANAASQKALARTDAQAGKVRLP